MSKVAFVFPGQGSQYVGMGKDLYEQSDVARSFFQKADEILGFPLSSVSFSGPEEKLRQTQITQPAIFLHSIVLGNLLKNPHADMTAGHSLGEYTALVFAGALRFEDGLQLVRLRGKLMKQAGTEHPGTMAAVIGLERQTIEQVCREASEAGVVKIANLNAPGQVVISGSVPGVRRAMELAKGRKAKLVKELVVSGAFHSPLMQNAQMGLEAALQECDIRDPRIPVYSNVTAKPVRKADEVKSLLIEQLTAPVQWDESVRKMVEDGSKRFVEVGPGKVLQGLIRRTDSRVNVVGIDSWRDLSKL
ncbi:MAG: ACP S-malonyltransferase [Bacteroidota bacterium]